MNIILVTPNLHSQQNGTGRSLRALVDAYRRYGHRILTITADSPDPPGFERRETSTASDIICLPTLKNLHGSALVRIGLLSHEVKQRIATFQPDVVHCFSSLLLGATAWRIAQAQQIPLIYSHSTGQQDFEPLPFQSERVQRLWKAYAVAFCNLANTVLVSHPSAAHELQIKGVETPIELVTPGLELDKLAEGNSSKGRRILEIPEDAFVIGYFGNASVNQGLPLECRSFASFVKCHPSSRVLLWGTRETFREWNRHFAKAGIQSHLHFHQETLECALADVYAALDVLIAMRVSDLSQQIVMEAMAAGTPALVASGMVPSDLIRSGKNGFVLTRSSQKALLQGLEQAFSLTPAAKAEMRILTKRSVDHLSVDACAENMLQCYANADTRQRNSKAVQETLWEHASKVLDAEWQLWSQRAKVAGALLTDTRQPSRIRVLRHVFTWWRRLRRWTSRREWSVNLLQLPVYRNTEDEPGLILLQIDGLSRDELERALRMRRMPFLRHLLEREHYSLETMYSGLPATTPAVLGELFYGVPQAVPAFGFRDHRTGKVVQMFQPTIAATVESELNQRGAALLSGGSVYCDIYSGGAANSSFCPATTGWHNLEDASMWRRIILFFLNVMSLARIVAFGCIELVVAIFDGIRGIYRGKKLLQELIYIPRRLIVNIVLREIVAISAEIDATRGVPVMHANFLGYDENSHRRGPDSRFAHYALAGIDHAIRRIWNAAHASHRRNYHLWIMADHGQQRTIPYENEMPAGLSSMIDRIYRDGLSPTTERESNSLSSPVFAGIETLRAAWLKSKRSDDLHADRFREPEKTRNLPITVAIGPLGYIYWPHSLEDADKDKLARQFVNEAHIPLIIAAAGDKTWAWTEEGKFQLPDEAGSILAAQHPHHREVTKDLISLCRHADAGDFLISGWRKNKAPYSFVQENGGHAGPGPKETSGFVMLPADSPLRKDDAGSFRPIQLRQMALRVLGRESLSPAKTTPRETKHSLRLVTYNVHSCIGLDGRLSPSRIARVLASTQADIIALQELDVSRKRSGFFNQVAEIANAMEMEFHFHPSLNIAGEQYGNAILSRFPLRKIRSGRLPTPHHREPRGVLWSEVTVGDECVQVLTTHLGLGAREREEQVAVLLGSEWLGNEECRPPVILCGDFNFMPGARAYHQLTASLRDVQKNLERHQPRRTWFGPLPLTRIDHVFIGSRLQTLRIDVPRTRLSKISSDHLPLVVDLEILPATLPVELSMR